jgi:uncharacterized protein (TIGR03067 family)
MKLHVMFVGAVCAASSLFAAAQEQDSDKERLQGVWQAVSIVNDGEKAPADAVKGSQMIIKGNQFTFKGEEAYRGAFTVDASKSPKWITTAFIDTDNKEGGKALGIYELQGDQLKIAWRQKGERPKDFASAAESGVRSMVLKRHRTD